MRFKSLILFAIVVCCLVAAAGVSLAEEDQPTANRPGAIARLSGRLNFKLPTLFDFAKYKAQFHKGYGSIAEEMRRAKLFMARAFAVFIAGIKYMRRQSSMYLKINSMSDWTVKERRATLNAEPNRPAADESKEARGEQGERADEMLNPAANLDDIEHTLEEIVANKDENPDYSAIAAELEQRKRKRRNAAAAHELSLDDLWATDGGPQRGAELSPKFTPVVASNNPGYHQAAASERKVSNGDHGRPMSADEAKQIDRQALAGGFISHALGSLKRAFNGGGGGGGGGDRREVAARETVSMSSREGQPGGIGGASGGQQLDTEDKVLLDYRETGCFLPVKDQGLCGACYIFSVIAVFEYHHCMQTGKLVPFSEQYVVDCGKFIGLKGCLGGREERATQFVAEFGLELLAHYPYRAIGQKCPYSKALWAQSSMGHTKVKKLTDEFIYLDEFKLTPSNITELLETKGPLTITICYKDDFLDYGGGVDVLDNCGSGAHAMTIVGHGIEDGLEYWLIRNSFSLDFGLDGYYKLSKQVREKCLKRVGYVEAQFKPNKRHNEQTLVNKIQMQMLYEDIGA